MDCLKSRTRIILASLMSEEVSSSVTNAELAAILRCHPRTANRHLTSLTRLGLVRVERHTPNANGFGTDPSGRRLYPTEAALALLNSQDTLPLWDGR